MLWVDRIAIEIATNDTSGFFQPLLVAVVTRIAKRLSVIWIPELLLIPSVRLNVIYHCCCDAFASPKTHGTQRVIPKVACTRLLPSIVVWAFGQHAVCSSPRLTTCRRAFAQSTRIKPLKCQSKLHFLHLPETPLLARLFKGDRARSFSSPLGLLLYIDGVLAPLCIGKEVR
jgi:hypothetical protein